MSTMSPRAVRPPAWRQLLVAALIVFGAFLVGMLLFLLLWLDRRSDREFYKAPVPPTSAAQVFEPLPAPMPAEEAEGGASGMGRPEEIERPPPRVVERAAPPPPEDIAPAERPTAGATRMPVPLETPAPRYPSQALRRGETGTVMVRIHLGADGVPTGATVERSSRSRALDRAALDAVQRWRFRPAQDESGPIPGSVVVPIDFQLDR